MPMIVRDAMTEDAAAIAYILVDTWRQAYAGIMPDDFLAGLSVEAREKRLREGFLLPAPDRFVVLAEEDGGAVVGCAMGGACRDDEPHFSGEVYAIYVRPGHQHQGIGLALIRAAVKRLLALGHSSLLIWTLSENPSRGFYEALQGNLVRERQVEIGGMLFPEVGYGWEDLRRLEKMIMG